LALVSLDILSLHGLSFYFFIYLPLIPFSLPSLAHLVRMLCFSFTYLLLMWSLYPSSSLFSFTFLSLSSSINFFSLLSLFPYLFFSILWQISSLILVLFLFPCGLYFLYLYSLYLCSFQFLYSIASLFFYFLCYYNFPYSFSFAFFYVLYSPLPARYLSNQMYPSFFLFSVGSSWQQLGAEHVNV